MGATKAVFIAVCVIIVISIFGFVLNSAGLIGRTAVENVIFEHSYQKKQADKTASTMYSSQLFMLQQRLNNPQLTANARNEIQAQISAISILKSTKED
jgi:hypothetical protein